MAYIDRKQTEEAIRKYADQKHSNGEQIEYVNGILKSISVINEQPTADVVDVKHSRWENISGFDVCNICGTSPAYCEPKPNNPKGYPPYCHHCGAKMDGGKADNE